MKRTIDVSDFLESVFDIKQKERLEIASHLLDMYLCSDDSDPELIKAHQIISRKAFGK